jgi:hypothetical protein
MNRSRRPLLATALAIVAVGSLAVSGALACRSDLSAARDATARFRSLEKAGRAGYAQPPAPAPLHECIASFDNTGAMGFHYINGGLLDADVDVAHPEVLVYAPDRHGKRRLVALEYVVFQDAWIGKHGKTTPELFGQMFMPVGFPNRYQIPAFFALHVWLYKENPSGLFAPFNPRVSCSGSGRSDDHDGGRDDREASAATAALAAAAGAPRWMCQTQRASA